MYVKESFDHLSTIRVLHIQYHNWRCHVSSFFVVLMQCAHDVILDFDILKDILAKIDFGIASFNLFPQPFLIQVGKSPGMVSNFAPTKIRSYNLSRERLR